MALANLLAECIRDSVTSCIREQLFVTCAQKRQVCVWHWNVIGIRQNYQIRMCTKQKGMQSKFQRPKRSSLGIPCLQIVYLFRMLGRKKNLFDRIQDCVLAQIVLYCICYRCLNEISDRDHGGRPACGHQN